MWLSVLIILGVCLAGAVSGFFIYWIITNIKTLRANQTRPIKEESQAPLTPAEDTEDLSLEQLLAEADYVPDIPGGTDFETEDDDWLNNGIPEIQFEQDGSILNINVIASHKQDITSEETVINLKINLPPQYLARKGEGPYDIEITPYDSSPFYQSVQDINTVKPDEESVGQVRSLLDEIAIRPVESPVLATSQLMDDISIRPVETRVAGSRALMDEITVRPVESLAPATSQLMDDISIRPVETRVAGSCALMDEIAVKPFSGPVNIEYELLDDLITRRAVYQTKKAEPVETISVNEITEFLSEKRYFKQAVIPALATKFRVAPFLARKGEETGRLFSQAKNLSQKAGYRGPVIKALAALRIYNTNEFYIQDTNLAHAAALMQEPQIQDFTFKVIYTPDELDELIDDGSELVRNFSQIKRGLKRGMVVFLVLVDGELASMGWACMTEESKAIFGNYPYNDDLDGQACIVGDWTNPGFRDCGIYSSYVKYRRQQLLKEKGFTFERSIVDESLMKDRHSVTAQDRLELTYKRRTYINVSLPGILGVEFWKEYPLNGTDSRPAYQMVTLLILVLPSPPRVAVLSKKLRF